MDRWLSIVYNIFLFALLALSAMVYIPYISLQLVIIIIAAFTGSIFLLPAYLCAGLFLPVFMQGGGFAYMSEPSFLLLILFTIISLLIKPLVRIKSKKPFIWHTSLVLIYIIAVYASYAAVYFTLRYALHVDYNIDITPLSILTVTVSSILMAIPVITATTIINEKLNNLINSDNDKKRYTDIPPA